MQKEYAPHEQRVIAECAEYTDRLGNLEAFLLSDDSKGIGAAHRRLLADQAATMHRLIGILEARIALF